METVQLVLSANWLAILVGAVSIFVLGFIWYNPKVFGTAWMKGIGLTADDVGKGNMGMIFGVAFVMALLLAYSMARYPHEGPMHGALHASMTWLFIVAPVMITNSLYEQRSWTVIFINVGYWLVGLAVMGMVVYALGEWPYPEEGGEDEAFRMIQNLQSLT
ncbi:MAG: DUF1761 domain-containing protein [Flavobacteriales bacterium]|nr:DUF1761 domain-containing protein [Flavobacteriales bacterium]